MTLKERITQHKEQMARIVALYVGRDVDTLPLSDEQAALYLLFDVLHEENAKALCTIAPKHIPDMLRGIEWYYENEPDVVATYDDPALHWQYLMYEYDKHAETQRKSKALRESTQDSWNTLGDLINGQE